MDQRTDIVLINILITVAVAVGVPTWSAFTCVTAVSCPIGAHDLSSVIIENAPPSSAELNPGVRVVTRSAAALWHRISAHGPIENEESRKDKEKSERCRKSTSPYKDGVFGVHHLEYTSRMRDRHCSRGYSGLLQEFGEDTAFRIRRNVCTKEMKYRGHLIDVGDGLG